MDFLNERHQSNFSANKQKKLTNMVTTAQNYCTNIFFHNHLHCASSRLQSLLSTTRVVKWLNNQVWAQNYFRPKSGLSQLYLCILYSVQYYVTMPGCLTTQYCTCVHTAVHFTKCVHYKNKCFKSCNFLNKSSLNRDCFNRISSCLEFLDAIARLG